MPPIRIAILFALASASLSAQAQQTPAPVVENSVVKVHATRSPPDLGKPWLKQTQQEGNGSGVVIDGNRILTNAHVVAYASQIQIQANNSGDKVSAKVVAIARDMDLALLELEDKSFFDTHPPVKMAAALPKVRDQVFAYGFPTGGSSMSITKGIISRIEFVNYDYPTSGLRIQIDAALNPGNSGGPVMDEDKLVGLSKAIIAGSQSIGYIIPNEEIALFLRDVADGRYDGKPVLQDDVQSLENPAMREFLKVPAGVTGAVVRRPAFDTAAYPLKEWDVITKIGDTPIDNQGMIRTSHNLHVRFQYAVQLAAKDGKVPLTLVRAGKTLTVQVPVKDERKLLISSLDGKAPSYFLYGPIVFTQVSSDILNVMGTSAPLLNGLSLTSNPMITMRGAYAAPERQELVMISAPPFAHKALNGYSARAGTVVKSVGGVAVKSLAHMVTLLRDARDELVVIVFDSRSPEALVLRRKDMLDATEAVMNDNSIRAQASPDIMAVWKGK